MIGWSELKPVVNNIYIYIYIPVVTGMSTNHLPTHLLVADPAVLSTIFDKLQKNQLHLITSPLTGFSTKRKKAI